MNCESNNDKNTSAEDISYEKVFQVRWADLDSNAHMKSTAFSDYATETRFAYLEDFGFDLGFFRSHFVSPIIFEERVNFLREYGPQERVTVNIVVVSLSPSGHKWHVKHEFRNASSVLCAVVSVKGAWLSLRERKVAAPPPDVAVAFARLPKGPEMA